MKIVVVFARQRLRADVKSVKIERETYRFRFGRRLPYTLFQQHAQILSATTRPRPHSEGLSLPREAKACICKGATVILRLPDEHSLRPQRQLQRRGSSTPDTSWLAGLQRIHRYRSVLGRQPYERRPAPILNPPVLVIPGLPRVVANARVATHRRMPVRFLQEAGLKSRRHAQRQRPIDRIRNQTVSAPASRIESDADGSVLGVQPQLSACTRKAD